MFHRHDASDPRVSSPTYSQFIISLPRPYVLNHRHGPCFALQHHLPSLTEAESAPGEPHRLLPDEHLSWFCHCLQSGSRIHGIPCDSIVLSAPGVPDATHYFTGVHTDPQGKLNTPTVVYLSSDFLYGCLQAKSTPYCSFRIILVCNWNTK